MPLARWRFDPARDSGPSIAHLFQRAFALVLLAAFTSLASQVLLLIGSRGLLPATELFERARDGGVGFWDLPSLLWFWHGDAALLGLLLCGALLALLAFAGLRPRLCFALSAPLYLSYAVAGGEFTAFQWDNMLVEVALLAACLPADRPAPLAHFAFRVLLFKLYFESGIAKWQSPAHDWQDGSAMQFYYETAPLPAALAFYAHHLPAFALRVQSWGALVLELVVPWFIWGTRPWRLAAFAAFTGFQLINTATANYGFFTYLSLVLHVFLLSDADVARVRKRLGLAPPAQVETASAAESRSGCALVATRGRFAALIGAIALALWLAASGVTALLSFTRFGGTAPALRGGAPSALADALGDTYALIAPLRMANVYHLFGHITTERIEPQVQTRQGENWTEHDLRYKPGDVHRRPPYVAPHQPRVDFRLWFLFGALRGGGVGGMGFARGTPRYVAALLERLCSDPRAVQPLFPRELPSAPDAVRLAFYRYRFASRQAHAARGVYFERELLGTLPERRCR